MSTEFFQRTSSTADTFASVSLWAAASNSQPSARITLNMVAAVVEAERIVRETSRTVKEEEAEEREWDAIVSKPHVRAASRRMAAKARREYYAGETEEGGFAVE